MDFEVFERVGLRNKRTALDPIDDDDKPTSEGPEQPEIPFTRGRSIKRVGSH